MFLVGLVKYQNFLQLFPFNTTHQQKKNKQTHMILFRGSVLLKAKASKFKLKVIFFFSSTVLENKGVFHIVSCSGGKKKVKLLNFLTGATVNLNDTQVFASLA